MLLTIVIVTGVVTPPTPTPPPTQPQEVSLREVGNNVQIVKIDTEKYKEIASRYSVQGLPTLVLFKHGQPVDRIEGFVDARQLEQRLQYFLSSA